MSRARDVTSFQSAEGEEFSMGFPAHEFPAHAGGRKDLLGILVVVGTRTCARATQHTAHPRPGHIPDPVTSQTIAGHALSSRSWLTLCALYVPKR